MKIISKYKDFYDHLWFDADPDIVYVRKEKVCFNPLSDMIKHEYRKEIGHGTDGYIYRGGGNATLTGFTFGIYPFVYTSPAIAVNSKESPSSFFIKMLTKPEIETVSALESNLDRSNYLIKIASDYFKGRDGLPDKISFSSSRYYGRDGLSLNDIARYCWKNENPEIFSALEAPVFVVYCDDIIDSAYSGLTNISCDDTDDDRILVVNGAQSSRKIKYITNVCFDRLAVPVTKYWFDEINTINTYSNIENFLMSSRMDPIPVISNDGKIVAHGFDLKTSFRKM